MTTIRKLTQLSVLAYLDRAGDGGATTTEITQAHGHPASYQQRSNYVSAILRRLNAAGCAEQAGTERSALYRGTPVSRWRITAAGQRRYREDSTRAAVKAAMDARIEQAAAARETALTAARDEMAALVRSGGIPAVTAEWRAAKVAELRAVPCTLTEIGALFGLTGERVRQIEMYGTTLARPA